MEGLSGLIVWIFIIAIGAIIKSASKKQKTQPPHFPYSSDTDTAPKQQSTPAAPAKPASMASMLPPREEGSAQPVQVTVHSHLAPDCDTHDAPTMGSLGFISTEGKDPCHEEQFSDRAPTPSSVTQPGLTFDWSGDAMVKAFVMQEVLTRPAQRRAQ